jgi:hypothetical protein
MQTLLPDSLKKGAQNLMNSFACLGHAIWLQVTTKKIAEG